MAGRVAPLALVQPDAAVAGGHHDELPAIDRALQGDFQRRDRLLAVDAEVDDMDGRRRRDHAGTQHVGFHPGAAAAAIGEDAGEIEPHRAADVPELLSERPAAQGKVGDMRAMGAKVVPWPGCDITAALRIDAEAVAPESVLAQLAVAIALHGTLVRLDDGEGK